MLVENKILPKEINELFDDIIESSYQKITSKEKKIIHESLVIAFNGHDGQDRKSGEPYIYHPLEVAKIVAKVLPRKEFLTHKILVLFGFPIE